jgi:hypothetical protein
MGKSPQWAFPLALVLVLATAAAVSAHDPGGSGIEVEPASVTAGDTVVLAGTGLEPNSDRVLVLAGEDLVVEFSTVTTDAEGMFQVELTIPSHLPSGTYELRAIGDETLTVALEITAAAGGAEASPGPNAVGETVVPRERAPIELALIIVLVAVATAIGGLLVWGAERLRGTAGA